MILKSHIIEATRVVIEESLKNKFKNWEIRNIEEAKAATKQAEAQDKALQKAAEALQVKESKKHNAQGATSRTTVLDLDKAITKGKNNKQIKGHNSYKKPWKKGKKRFTEFETTTPKVRLF